MCDSGTEIVLRANNRKTSDDSSEIGEAGLKTYFLESSGFVHLKPEDEQGEDRGRTLNTEYYVSGSVTTIENFEHDALTQTRPLDWLNNAM
ncbi:hypothetical protein NPX13_g8304 [Xylaria arbuscula]|uniref:Uncharacterized protein n=1 Tax=Xylaria arbuscula TaxID=114810 RepID=A0A9W8N8V1_9PEZI|nr:hypothetical protein NPX13_g8304 [Xylaria arbuscula]